MRKGLSLELVFSTDNTGKKVWYLGSMDERRERGDKRLEKRETRVQAEVTVWNTLISCTRGGVNHLTSTCAELFHGCPRLSKIVQGFTGSCLAAVASRGAQLSLDRSYCRPPHMHFLLCIPIAGDRRSAMLLQARVAGQWMDDERSQFSKCIFVGNTCEIASKQCRPSPAPVRLLR